MIHHNSGNLIQNPDHFSSCCIFKNVNWSTGFQQRVCALHELPSAAFWSDFCDTVALKWPPPLTPTLWGTYFSPKIHFKTQTCQHAKKDTLYTLPPGKFQGCATLTPLEISRCPGNFQDLEKTRAPGIFQATWKNPGFLEISRGGPYFTLDKQWYPAKSVFISLSLKGNNPCATVLKLC